MLLSTLPLMAVLAVGPKPMAPVATTRLALALGVRDGGGEPEFLESVRQQIRLGLDGATPSLKWDDYESQNGKPLTDAIGGAKLMGQEIFLTISTIDTLKRRMPSDVNLRRWNDPELLSRFDEFLTKVAKQLGQEGKWVSLGNEVNVYFDKFPDEVEGYLAFLARGREALKRANPKLQVGVTLTYGDAFRNPALAKRLQEGMDISVFTYYPVNGNQGNGTSVNGTPISGAGVPDFSQVPTQFDWMAKFGGPKPLLLQEIGYPASEAAGGSPAKQAEFIRLVFKQLDRLSSQIPLASFFSQYDFPSGLVKIFESYYGISEPSFLAFIGSLGLHDRLGNPRPAWDAFREEMVKRRPIR